MYLVQSNVITIFFKKPLKTVLVFGSDYLKDEEAGFSLLSKTFWEFVYMEEIPKSKQSQTVYREKLGPLHVHVPSTGSKNTKKRNTKKCKHC